MNEDKKKLEEFVKLEHDLLSEENTYIEKGENQFNAPSNYIIRNSHDNSEILRIHFQTGGTKDEGLNGIFMEDLIGICLDRLESFNHSNFRCRENSVAITHLEEVLMWLRRRTNKRIKRGVLGKDVE